MKLLNEVRSAISHLVDTILAEMLEVSEENVLAFRPKFSDRVLQIVGVNAFGLASMCSG